MTVFDCGLDADFTAIVAALALVEIVERPAACQPPVSRVCAARRLTID
jgi:hypothetical protein